MNGWYALIQQAAIQRIDEIECHLLAPPQYAEAARMLRTAMDEYTDDVLKNVTTSGLLTPQRRLLNPILLMHMTADRFIMHSPKCRRFKSRRRNTMNRLTHEHLKALRKQYPAGCRVRLTRMNDPYRLDLKEGVLGTVLHVDDIGTIHVSWDCGSSLGVVLGEDSCSRIDEEDVHD